MNKSKIEWCEYTWNPITGCLHGCPYCYARRIAERFGKFPCENSNCTICGDCSLEPSYTCKRYIPYKKIHDLNEPIYSYNPKRIQPYPYAFEPTFHRYRIDEPKRKTKGVNIFVCSMADLFGEWVPNEWIREVFKVCKEASQHRYMFLTKNPSRYAGLFDGIPDETMKNWWFGQSLPTLKPHNYVWAVPNHFLSIEPLLEEPQECDLFGTGWVIVGAQTGPGAKPPKKEWVQNIIDQARAAGVPIFLKDNLHWPEKIQEFPEMT